MKLKNIIFCGCGERWQDLSPLILRFITGLAFIMHGWMKYPNIEGFTGFLTSMNVPMAAFFGPFIVYLEIVGGGLLIVGLLTHWVSKLLAINMLVAVALVHWKNGFFVQDGGYELALLLLAMSLSLMITGAGRWSLDHLLLKKTPEHM